MFCFVLWLLQLFHHINVSPETLPLCFIQLCCALCAFAVFFSICWCVFLELAVCLTSQSHHKKVYFYSFLFVQDHHSKTFTSVASPSHTNPLHVFHSHILFHRLLFFTRLDMGLGAEDNNCYFCKQNIFPILTLCRNSEQFEVCFVTVFSFITQECFTIEPAIMLSLSSQMLAFDLRVLLLALRTQSPTQKELELWFNRHFDWMCLSSKMAASLDVYISFLLFFIVFYSFSSYSRKH